MTSLGQVTLFQQGEGAGGRAELERRGEGAHIRIADQEVQPPVTAEVGERFVPRIDDRAIELHPLIDVVDDVIGALGELERDGVASARQLRNRRPAGWPARRAPRQ